MKLRTATCLASMLVSMSSYGGGFVSESATEFHSTGDFDGDGREDQIIVDKATGTYRIGYQLVVDVFTWTQPRGSGLTEITGCAVGKLRPPSVGVTARDALAVTSGPANRIAICSAEDAFLASNPVDVFPANRGTFTVVATDIGGAGNSPDYDDLLAVSWWNGINDYKFETIRGGATHPTEGVSSSPYQWASGNAVKLQVGGNPVVGFTSRGEAGGRFRFYNPMFNPVEQVSNNLFVGPETQWVSGFFGGSNFATLLEYERGSTQLHTHAVSFVANNYNLANAVTFTMAGSLDFAVVLDGPSDTRILLILDAGQAVQILDFDGVNAPVVAMTIFAPPGLEFTGATAVAGGHLQLYSGAIGSGRSTQFDYYKRSGVTYALQQTGNLAVPLLHSGRRSLLVFSDEPFANLDARLLASLPGGDWTSDGGLLPGNLVFTAESFVSSTAGLGNPQSIDLGSPPMGATWAMPNQHREDVSVVNLSGNPAGVPSVQAIPSAGEFTRAVQIMFQAEAGTDLIFYRTGLDQAWGTRIGSGAGPLLTTTATLQFYAQRGPVQSPITTRSYRLPAPENLDSDGDRVPDFVELANGMNPLGGSDSDADGTDDFTELLDGTNPLSPLPARIDTDGDGFTDTQEMLAGTDANDASSVPPLRGGFSLEATVRMFVSGGASGHWPIAGSIITARMCDGLPLATDACESSFLHIPPAAVAHFASLNPSLESPLIVLSTPSTFVSTAPTVRHGAELFSVVATPQNLAPAAINYVPGSGPAAWIAAAQAARAAVIQPSATATLSPAHTLSGLLIEAKLRSIFADRNVPNAARLTLFGFSVADERCIPLLPEQGAAPGPIPISPALLATLEQRQSELLPGYDLRSLATVVTDAVLNGATAEVAALRKLAFDLYEKYEDLLAPLAGGALNPSALAYSPANMLRCFLVSNPLPADYLAVTALTPAELLSAAAAPALIHGLVQPRATRTATLTVGVTSFEGTTTILNEASVPQTVALVQSTGERWRFNHGFHPAVGSVILVLGYTDATVPLGAAAALEVISANVLSVPENLAGSDADQDGLADAWELAFFGTLSQTGAGDFDSDGQNNSAEFAAGTDPSDGIAAPAPTLLASLHVPELEISQPEAGVILLGWNYPEQASSAVRFSIECSPSLSEPGFEPVSASIYQPQPGTWIARVVQTEPERCFFRLRITER